MPNQQKVIYESRKELKALQLYNEGMAQADIARELGTHQQFVSRAINKALRLWQKEYNAESEKLLTKRIKQLDTLMAESWQAWRESKGEHIEVTEKEVPFLINGAIETRAERTIKKAVSPGDPRFIKEIGACLDKVCKLEGLYAPDKLAMTNPDGTKPYQREYDFSGLTDDELETIRSITDKSKKKSRNVARKADKYFKE